MQSVVPREVSGRSHPYRGSIEKVSPLIPNTAALYWSGVILVIFEPCNPSPAISPFWPKIKA